MPSRRASVLAAAVLCLSTMAPADPAVVAGLIARLRRGDPEAKPRLVAAGTRAIASLFALLGDSDARTASEARSTLRSIAIHAGRPAAPDGHRAKVLAAALPYLDAKLPVAQRRAAIDMLGLAGDDAAVPRLAALLGDDALAQDAALALANIGSDAARRALSDKLPAAHASLQPLLRALLQRPRDGADRLEHSPALPPDEARAVAALARLGRSAPADAVAGITPHLTAPSATVRAAAYGALCDVSGAEGARAIAAALPQAPVEMRPALVRALGRHAHPASAPTLSAASKSTDELIATEALWGLERLGSFPAASALADAAKAAAMPRLRSLALAACIRLGHRLADQGHADQALAVFQRIHPLATADADRAAVLRGLAKTGLPAVADLIVPIARDKDSALRGAATEALIGLADYALAKHRNAAVAIYKQVIDVEAVPALAEEATRKLFALGVPYSLAAKKGFVTSWWLIGPFGCRDFNDAKRPRPPEADPALDKTHRDGTRELRWQLHHTMHAQGIVDLDALFTPNDKVLAYAYTELTAPQDMPVKFWLRRDDGLTLWLNDKVLYHVHDAHGTAIAEYPVAATLVKGANRLLVKCSEGGGLWEFSLRMTDPAGKPFGEAD